jgi:hypothetical protein
MIEDKIAGYLEVGRNDKFEVIINFKEDIPGIGHVVFSPNQARNLARLLIQHAEEAEEDYAEAYQLWGDTP